MKSISEINGQLSIFTWYLWAHYVHGYLTLFVCPDAPPYDELRANPRIVHSVGSKKFAVARLN